MAPPRQVDAGGVSIGGGPLVLIAGPCVIESAELCLTIGPLMAGPGAPRIVAGTPGTDPVATPLPLILAHVLEDNGFLLCRYIRKDN